MINGHFGCVTKVKVGVVSGAEISTRDRLQELEFWHSRRKVDLIIIL